MAKTQFKRNSDFVYANKIWRENPPGPEQKELDRLFSNGLISEIDNANDVRLKHPIFREFSVRVFACHFRKTKAKHGLMLRTSNEVINTRSIPELGSISATNFEIADEIHSDVEMDSTTEFSNAPFYSWVWPDHEEKCKYVQIVAPIFSGTKDFDFIISEDGKKVTINYSWPTALYKPKVLFQDEMLGDDPAISFNHPKIHALTSFLLSSGITGNASPRGKITISLPIKVQREIGTWKKKAIKKEDGSRFILLQFKGFQEDSHIKDADTTISFD